MKRLFCLFISPLFLFCSHKDQSHIKVFKKFYNSAYRVDKEMISILSTESTNAIISDFIDNGMNPVYAILRDDIVTKTSDIQSNLKVVRDSISQDNLLAWIWFRINDIDKLYIVEMVKVNGQWKVDLPLI